MAVTYQFRVIGRTFAAYERLQNIRAGCRPDQWPELFTPVGGHRYAMGRVLAVLMSEQFDAGQFLAEPVRLSSGRILFNDEGEPLIDRVAGAFSHGDITPLGDWLTVRFMNGRNAQLFAYAMRDHLTDMRPAVTQ